MVTTNLYPDQPEQADRGTERPAPDRLSRRAWGAIFAIALVLRLAYLFETAQDPIWHWHTWNETDMDTFLKVARQILSGDWQVRNPYHPYHGPHRTIASAEQWQAWYGGPNVFYHVPGYYYLLALMLKVFSGSLLGVRIAQVILGALHAVVLGAVAQRVMGPVGGAAVAVMAACYGPAIALEPMILRDGAGLLLSALSLYLVLRALDRSDRAPSRVAGLAWFAAGMTLGLGALIKEIGFVLFGGTLLWMTARSLISRAPRQFLAAVLLLAGFAASWSPLLLRNQAVGVSPLAVAPLFPYNFALANAADAPDGGALFTYPSPAVGPIMAQSGGRLLATVLSTLEGYREDPTRFLVNLWKKFSAIWSNVEQPDNFSHGYLVLHSRLLQAAPRFVCIWLPALLGLTMLIARWWMDLRPVGFAGDHPRRQQFVADLLPFNARALGLLLSLLAIHVALQSVAPVVSRYRMAIVPFLMLFAGWTWAQAWSWAHRARGGRLLALSSGLAALCMAWLAWPADAIIRDHAIRPSDFIVGATFLADRGDLAGARREFDIGLAYYDARSASQPVGSLPERLLLRLKRFELFVTRKRFAEVRDDWEVLRLALGRDHPALREIERQLFLDLGVAPDADAPAQRQR